MSTAESIGFKQETEINPINYRTLVVNLARAVATNNIVCYGNQKVIQVATKSILTASQYRTYHDKRKDNNNYPDASAKNYKTLAEHHDMEVQKVNLLQNAITSKISPDVISKLDSISYSPTLAQVMDFLDDQYGKISTIEDLSAKDNMTLAFSVPTSPNNIQEAIDSIEGRYIKHFNQYMPTITEETKEVLKSLWIYNSIKHTISNYPHLKIILNQLPIIFTSQQLLDSIYQQYRNWDFTTKASPSSVLATTTSIQSQYGVKSDINTKKCLCHRWNPSHVTSECMTINNYIRNLSDEQLKVIRTSSQSKTTTKSKSKKFKKGSAKAAAVDSDSDDTV